MRRSAWIRLMGRGARQAAAIGIAVAMVVPACGGRSITAVEDDGNAPGPPPADDGSMDDDSFDDGFSGGRGGSSGGFQGGMGAVGNLGGTIAGGAFPTGGVPPCAGDGGTTSEAPGVPSGTPGASNPPECLGVYRYMPCGAFEGRTCANLVCGLADSGVRDCACSTNWTCTDCDFTHSPFRDRPCNIPPCTPDVADEVPCALSGTVCGPVNLEYCACYQDPSDGLVWDCDDPPSTWGLE